MAEPVSGEFTRMLDATMRALGAVSTSTAGDNAAEDEAAPPVGEAADGQVRAELGPDGRLRSLWVEPRLMRLSSPELTECITEAVNNAIDAGRAATTTPQPADLSQLQGELAEIRDTAVPRLQSFLRALTDAQDRFAQGVQR